MSKEVIRELEIIKKSNERVIAKIKKKSPDLYNYGYINALKSQNRLLKLSIKCRKGIEITPF